MTVANYNLVNDDSLVVKKVDFNDNIRMVGTTTSTASHSLPVAVIPSAFHGLYQAV
jgi:hypothetical protein